MHIFKSKYERLQGVDLEYERQLYFQCLLKYMVFCAFDNPPQFQASWQHKLFTLDMGSLKKWPPFLFIAVLLLFFFVFFFLYIIAANNSVLLLYACAHKISLKYLFPEKIVIEICCQKCHECNTFCVTNLFSIELQGFVKKIY